MTSPLDDASYDLDDTDLGPIEILDENDNVIMPSGNTDLSSDFEPVITEQDAVEAEPILQDAASRDPGNFLLAFRDLQKIQQPEQSDQARMGHDPSRELVKQVPNTLRDKLPPGATQIDPRQMPEIVSALAQSFPSMGPTGILLDPNDRTAYALSVLGNPDLKSDLKARLIDEAMKTGKLVPEALSKDWFDARGITIMIPQALDEMAKKGLGPPPPAAGGPR